MPRFAIALASQSNSRLGQLLVRLGAALRPANRTRAAKLDLARLSHHDLRDLGFQPPIYPGGWLAAPWLPLNHERLRPDDLPPI